MPHIDSSRLAGLNHHAEEITSGTKRAADMIKNLRILIADDHDLMRRGLKALVESHPGWQVCEEAHTGLETIEKAERS